MYVTGIFASLFATPVRQKYGCRRTMMIGGAASLTGAAMGGAGRLHPDAHIGSDPARSWSGLLPGQLFLTECIKSCNDTGLMFQQNSSSRWIHYRVKVW